MKRYFSKSTLSGILCLVCTAVLTFSCKGKTQGSESPTESTINQEEAITFDTIKVKEFADSILLAEYNIECFNSNTPSCDSVNKHILSYITEGKAHGDMRQALQKSAQLDIEKLRANAMDFDLAEEVYGEPLFYIIKKGTFETNSADDVWAYTLEVEDFLGGAHGTYQVNTYNFSKTTGKLITLEDVIDTTKNEEITVQLLVQLLKDKKCATVEQLMEETGLLSINDLYVSDNFCLGKDGITFRYGQYSIGPYSAGITEITLDYSTLSYYMKNK